MASPAYNSGNGANILCLVKDIQPPEGAIPGFAAGGRLYGMEYEFNDPGGIMYDSGLDDQDIPCAVCEVPRSAVMMVPGKRTCPQGWIKEYEGLLMSERHDRDERSEYVCVSLGMETLPDGSVNVNDGLLFVVELGCGVLPCSTFQSGIEVSCVVCSK